jgi:molybdopterin molybdotransferase
MPELFNVLTPQEAYNRLEAHLSPTGRTERIATKGALGRVLAEDVLATDNLPSFAKSAMDGYAVRAEDTFGASEALPAYLKMAGEVPMGSTSEISIQPGEAALVQTGGALAEGTNAVVMVENTRKINDSSIEVVRPVAVGENVLQVGEDIRKGKPLLPRGQFLRPQDIGGLLSMGITKIAVSQQVRVALIATGDELVSPEMEPGPGQVRDINTYALSALTLEAGGIPLPFGIVEDDYTVLRTAAEKAIGEADIVIISAGSSVSTRDITAQVIDSLGQPGILVHGISLKPGKPTILAVVNHNPVFGLPGNPGSAMATFDLFVTPTIYRLSGCNNPPIKSKIQAKLMRNLPSAPGREDYIPVKLEEKDGEWWADPVFGKSNFISILMKADGMAQVPLNKAGLSAGERVTVRIF